MKISKEVRVGLFMVVSLVLLYLGFNYLKGIDFFSSRKKYYTFYDNVDKLMPSNQVYVNGYAIGRVSKIQYQQKINKVMVELEIDSDITLGDSSIAILNGDILGTKFIQLIVGNSTKALKPKDTIQSDVAKGISDFLTENAAPVASNLQTTLTKFNSLLDNLNTNSQKLNLLLDDYRIAGKSANKTIVDANAKIAMVAGSLKSATDNLSVALNDLKPTIKNFRTFSDSLKSVEIGKTLAKTQSALNKFNETLARLNSGDNTMSKLLTEDSLYVNLNQLLGSLDSLANHMNENPKHFFGPLGQSRKKIQRDLEKQRKEQNK
jgi:phospholipid/cholesterol/gamma-HCH transport system substrate-binding protein